MSTHSGREHVGSTGGAARERHASRYDLAITSAALTIAAAEFVVCALVLRGLNGLGMLSAAGALSWGGVTLVPLSLSIGFPGVVTGRLGRTRSSISPGNLAQVG